MASNINGCDSDFLAVDAGLASQYECLICYHLARDPLQAKCCGATCCRHCVSQLDGANPHASRYECPNCRELSPAWIEDKAQRQKINKLKVKCSHCEWTGELADAHTHLESVHSGSRQVPRLVAARDTEEEGPEASFYYQTDPKSSVGEDVALLKHNLEADDAQDSKQQQQRETLPSFFDDADSLSEDQPLRLPSSEFREAESSGVVMRRRKISPYLATFGMGSAGRMQKL